MTTGSINVLYVDADRETAETTCTALEQVHEALAVDTVRSAAEVDAYLEKSPDSVACVVSVYDLPETDGIAMLSELCDTYPEIYTILFAEQHSADLVEKSYDAGVDEYLPAAGSRSQAVLAHHIYDSVERRRTREAIPHPEAHFRTLAQSAADAIVTIDTNSIIKFVNPAIEDILGYSPDELRGRPLAVLMDDSLAEKHRAGFERYLETGIRRLNWSRVELPGRHKDGHDVPLDISFGEFSHEDQRYFTGILRDLTDRRRHEERLLTLNEVTSELMSAEDAQEVCDLVVETASEMLDLPFAAVELYDESQGRLFPAARTPAVANLVGDDPLFAAEREIPWRAYAEREEAVYADLAAQTELGSAETPFESAVVLPLGRHGVFNSGATAPDAFSDTDVTLLRILAVNAEAALDRVDREQDLRERSAALAERTDTLERTTRVNSVVRELTQALLHATSRSEVEALVCHQLAATKPYRFVWVGRREITTGAVVPQASAGVGKEYLDSITVGADENPSNQNPTSRAIDTRETQVENRLFTDPPFESWRAEALQRGYRACIAVPLVFRESIYGVLTLYADRPDVFDDEEVSVLTELGETIGYATNSLERKSALIGNAAVELVFTLTDMDIPAIQLARATNSVFKFESMVEHADGSLRAFFTVEGAEPETVRRFADQTPVVRECTLLSENDGGCRFEATVTESGFLGSLLEYGARPTAITATAEEARVAVEIPQNSDVRAFIEMFLRTHEGATLVARRERDRPVRDESEFRALYKDRLTERQEEVIRTAYFAGFFEWPRESTGQEVADLLGVSQPTVNRHIRTGERNLFDLIFADE